MKKVTLTQTLVFLRIINLTEKSQSCCQEQ